MCLSARGSLPDGTLRHMQTYARTYWHTHWHLESICTTQILQRQTRVQCPSNAPTAHFFDCVRRFCVLEMGSKLELVYDLTGVSCQQGVFIGIHQHNMGFWMQLLAADHLQVDHCLSFCFDLFHIILCHFVSYLSHPALFCSVLFCSVLFCSVLFCSGLVWCFPFFPFFSSLLLPHPPFSDVFSRIACQLSVCEYRTSCAAWCETTTPSPALNLL